MNSTLKVDIDLSGAFAAFDVLSRSQLQAAWRRALRKTGDWAKHEAARAVSRETGIPQKVLKQRLYFFLRSLDQAKVWLGLNAIPAHQLGTVRPTRTGVTVGRFRFPGAWVMTKRRPEGPVYERTGQLRSVRTPNGRLQLREAYRVVHYDFADAGEKAFDRVAQDIEQVLLIKLRQELNFEALKNNGRT